MITARYQLHGLLHITERDRHLQMLTPRLARELPAMPAAMRDGPA